MIWQSRRRKLTMSVAAAALLTLSRPAMAAPEGSTVTSGNASVSQSGTTTTVNQSTDTAIINWQSFSIAGNETVNFVQPCVSSSTLNRVIGNEQSIIDGALNATGKVYLVNSAGVLIGAGAHINASSFTASALDIADADFLAGKFSFSGSGSDTGDVINQGSITAGEGGQVILLGRIVSNQGVIVATKGSVVMASGNKISLNFNGDSLVDVTIDEGVLNALVENKQAIYADGGMVVLTAKAADDLVAAQVNNTGLIQARTIGDLTGNILLYAHGGTTTVDGTLDASAPESGDGGFIETSGDTVKVADTAIITTQSAYGSIGTWLIDPTDFTIAASGGDITGTTLSSLLNNNSISISSTQGSSGTSGNINVNDTVNWSADTVLTLTATNNININKSITATGTNSGLALNFGGDYAIDTSSGAKVTLSGSSATLAINGQAYTLIHSLSQLDALDGYNAATASGTASDVSGYYAIAEDLDGSGTTYSAALLGYSASAAFLGTLAGLGHTISNLTISTTSGSYIGLISALGSSSNHTATVRDLGLVSASITGKQYVGGLVGRNYGVLSNDYVNGSITSTRGNTGGLAGRAETGSTIKNSYSTGTVTSAYVNTGSSSSNYVGGLVGINYGTITDSWSSATVNATNMLDVGGLVGSNYGTLSNVQAKGAVTVAYTISLSGGSFSNQNIGGLAGSNYGTISTASASGNVTVTSSKATTSSTYQALDVGGLVGYNAGTITNSSASGNVGGTNLSMVGGLVGNNTVNAVISGSSASGNVSGYNSAGGFVGFNAGSITTSSASGDVSTVYNTGGGFVGQNAALGTITNSSASGNVTSQGWVGGFAGTNSGTIDNVTATGTVSATTFYNADGTPYFFVGALVGNNTSGTVSNSTAVNTGTSSLVGNGGTVTNSTFRDSAAAASSGSTSTTTTTSKAATATASTVSGSNADVTSTTAGAAQTATATTDLATQLDNNIEFGTSAGVSGDVQSIEVDGVRYQVNELEGDAERNEDKPPPKN